MLLLAGLAVAAEHRQIEVADGRVLLGEVVATGDQGLTLRLPQGLADVLFTDIVRLDPVAAELVAAQPALRVLVLPSAGADPATEASADQQLLSTFAAVPYTRVTTLEALPPTVPEATRAALRACALDTTCVVSAATDVPVDIVVMPVLREESTVEELVLASVWLDAPRAQRRVSTSHPPGPEARAADVATAAWQLLGLQPVDGAARAGVEAAARSVIPAPVQVPSPPVQAPKDRSALAFIPLPGITAFVDGRPGAGAAALGVVVPATAALVYVAGHESARASTAVAVSVLGYYTMCVVSNRIVAPVMVTPTVGGAMLSTGGRF